MLLLLRTVRFTSSFTTGFTTGGQTVLLVEVKLFDLRGKSALPLMAGLERFVFGLKLGHRPSEKLRRAWPLAKLAWVREHRPIRRNQKGRAPTERIGGQITDFEHRRMLPFLAARLVKEAPTVADHPDAVDRRRARNACAVLYLVERQLLDAVGPSDRFSQQEEQNADGAVRDVCLGQKIVENEVGNRRRVW
jgi:hypothetical protein